MKQHCLLFAFCISFSLTQFGYSEKDNAIQSYTKNSRYWQYKSQPLLLLGGSKDDNLFQIPDLEQHLDLMVSVGGNYIRNTMSARNNHGYEVQPFAKQSNGKYDLNKLNPEYWNRFEILLKLTQQRDIIVQIEIWAFHDFNKDFYGNNPWRPNNNINYSTDDTKLKNTYGYIGRKTHDFFLTVPKLNNDRKVLRLQQKFVDTILSFALNYDNVLYCITNEIHPPYSPEWGWYWAAHIQKKAAAKNKQVHITEMFWEIDLKKKQHRASLDHPDIYTFFEASQNSSKKGEENGSNLNFVYRYLEKHPRPINHVKIYGGKDPEWARTPTDGKQRFWRNIIGGSASSRFHRPPAGNGLSQSAQANIRSMRMLTDGIDIFSCKPRQDLLIDRKPNQAWALVKPGKTYLIYFPEGDPIKLDLRNINGSLKVKWLDIEKSHWSKNEILTGGSIITLTPPERKPWALQAKQIKN